MRLYTTMTRAGFERTNHSRKNARWIHKEFPHITMTTNGYHITLHNGIGNGLCFKFGGYAEPSDILFNRIFNKVVVSTKGESYKCEIISLDKQ